MNHQRILLTLRGDQFAAERFRQLVDRATKAGRSVNTQALVELGIIDDAEAAQIPRAGRYHRHRATLIQNADQRTNDDDTNGRSADN